MRFCRKPRRKLRAPVAFASALVPIILAVAVPGSALASDRLVYTKDAAVCSPGCSHEIWSAERSGLDARAVRTGSSADSLALSPDGQQIVYAHAGNLYLMDIDGGEARILLDDSGYHTDPKFHPNGTEVWYSSNGDIYKMSIFGAGIVRVIDWAGSQKWPAISADGTKLAFTSDYSPAGKSLRGQYIYTTSIDGSAAFRVTGSSNLYDNARGATFSRSGSQLAFSGCETTCELFRINADGSGLLRLTSNAYFDGQASWSWDGTQIAFVSERPAGGANAAIYTINPDGSGEAQLLTAPGTTGVAYRQPRVNIDPANLLARYAPQLQYDSQEQYMADAADTITDNYYGTSLGETNTLQRSDGAVVATANPALGAPLSLGFLDWPNYANGALEQYTDKIDELDTYESDAARMHADPFYANKIYGRVKQDSSGRSWLQYWFWYYYNPWSVAGFGAHEGDWEMIQLRLDANGAPDWATYSQHKDDDAESCPYYVLDKQVSWNGDYHPVVYVARGSHASYVTPGSHYLGWAFVYDNADGQGFSVRPSLEVITDTSPTWVKWEGQWGGSDSSPRGPREQGSKWSDPAAFDAQAGPCEALAGSASGATRRKRRVGRRLAITPRIQAAAHEGSVAVEYSLVRRGRGRNAARQLMITVHPRKRGLLPTARRVRLRQLHGRARLRLPLGDGPYKVRASALSRNGVRSRVVATRVR